MQTEAYVFSGKDIAATFCAIFIPPVAVAIETGCSMDLLLNFLLTLLGWFPGAVGFEQLFLFRFF